MSHWKFPRHSNHHDPEWLYPPPHHPHHPSADWMIAAVAIVLTVVLFIGGWL